MKQKIRAKYLKIRSAVQQKQSDNSGRGLSFLSWTEEKHNRENLPHRIEKEMYLESYWPFIQKGELLECAWTHHIVFPFLSVHKDILKHNTWMNKYVYM